MNKMIKRQDLAPPWIEKQQELVKEANAFRSRLRSDWKRHAARMIASSGGSLESQIERAREYARAEEVHNPRRHNVEDIAVPTNSTEDVMVAVRRQDSGETTTTTLGESAAETPSTSALLAEKQPPSSVPHIHPQVTLSQPFRDPAWEERERAYMELAIQKLNSLARSYNLMAPDLAKKPYFSLERELRHCYADVAPLLADEIRTRALAPAKDLYGGRGGHAQGTYVSMFGSGDWKSTEARIYDDKTPHYGLREMWADLWKGWKDGRAKEGSR